MRKIVLLPAIAASALAFGFAGATQVSGSGPAAPPTTIPGLDQLATMGLTPEQTQCLVDNSSGIDMSDMNAIMGLMTDCGINPMDLLGATDTASDVVAVTETAPTENTSGAGELDQATVTAILGLLGVDPTSLQCIEDGLSSAVPDDDNAALTVLQGCGLALTDVLAGLVSVNDVASVGDLPTTPSVEGPDATGTGVGSSSGIVEQLQQLLRDQYGIELTDDQASCLLDNVSGIDMSDMNATLAVFESCGISLTDLAG